MTRALPLFRAMKAAILKVPRFQVKQLSYRSDMQPGYAIPLHEPRINVRQCHSWLARQHANI